LRLGPHDFDLRVVFNLRHFACIAEGEKVQT
jgi:hypothetical protein